MKKRFPQKINLTAKNAPIRQILKAVFKFSLPLTWRLKNPFSLCSLFFSLGLGLSALLADTIPQQYPLDRYDSLRKHLPFGKPTVIETEAPKPPPFTEDLTLLGFSKVGSGYFVTLLNKKTQQKILLSPKDKPDGITVAEVLNNSTLAKVEIKLKKGNEIASVKFDPNFLTGAQPGNPMNPMTENQNNSPDFSNANPPPTPFAGQPPQSNDNGTLFPTQNQNVNPNQNGNPSANQNQQPGTPPSPIKRIRRVIVPTQSP